MSTGGKENVEYRISNNRMSNVEGGGRLRDVFFISEVVVFFLGDLAGFWAFCRILVHSAGDLGVVFEKS